MPPPATGEQFLDAVRRSGLLPDALVQPYLQAVSGEQDAQRTLAQRLIRNSLLTPFQARQLLDGKTRGFFLAGKYKVLSLIGTGGMGHVYLCEHLVLQRLVAVKVLQQAAAQAGSGGSVAALERFIREARAVAALDHPNIVRVYDMEQTGGVPFMVMEYVDGTSLHQIVTDGGPFSPARAAHCVAQAAAGLQHAHENGLIHRDVKPGNLLLDRFGIVKLLDLGLARFHRDTARNENLTARYNEDSAVVGTADYMSPEQAFNAPDLDIRSDLYSLGATLYFLLTGKAPFEGESLAQKLIAHQYRQPKAIQSFRSDVAGGLIDVQLRLMAKNPEDRYRTPSELIADLKEWTREPVPPPISAELPKMPPSAYRLGLIVGPSGRSANLDQGSWEFPLAPGNADQRDTPRASLDSTGPRLPRANPPEDPTAPLPSEFRKPSATPPKTAITRRRALVAGGSILAALGAGVIVWRRTRGSRDPETPSNPTPPPPTGVTITGSGSTFIQPAFAHWSPIYERLSGVKIKYDGIGSGRGVENMIDRVLQFGCTDAPMSDAQIAKARTAHGEVVHIPLALGAVVATYNLPDVSAQLRITGSVLADIYLGKIAKWNHPAIAAGNPGLSLPDLDITPYHRADNSGTTFIWTDFLKKSSAEWEAKIGAGNTVKWPVGPDADKNDGVANAVSKKLGAIGYVELSFALERNLRFARVKNQTGRFVEPSFESVTAAANASLRNLPADLRYSLTDAPGDDSYPIAGGTWAVLYAAQPGPAGADLVKFLRWAVHDGQVYLKELRYAPLPASLVNRIDEKLAAITTG